MPNFPPRFFRTTAVCSFVSAVTTLGLIFLPRLWNAPRSFEENVALLNNPIYTLRLWVYLFHPVFVLMAAMGVSVRLASTRAWLVLPGLLGFTLWAFAEMIQQSLALVANHYAWRGGYAAADDATKAMIRSQMFGFSAVWDALYVLLLIGFIAGNTLYGAAFKGMRGLGRALRVFYFAAAALSVFYFLGAFNVALWADPYLDWVYPFQPIARATIGVWLWQQATEVARAQTSPQL